MALYLAPTNKERLRLNSNPVVWLKALDTPFEIPMDALPELLLGRMLLSYSDYATGGSRSALRGLFVGSVILADIVDLFRNLTS